MTVRKMKQLGRKGQVIYSSTFDPTTGNLVRIANFPDDSYLSYSSEWVWPKAPSPELVDIAITNRCGFGCTFCYQDSTSQGKHGPKELVRRILEGFDQVPYQIAIGGGEPTIHPDFVEIIRDAAETGTVVNYTTAGHNMTQEIMQETNRSCGGVAMTFHAWKGKNWFVDHYKKIRKGLDCQLNVHLIADKNVGETLPLLIDLQKEIGPVKLVLLAYYPEVGRASTRDLISRFVYTKVLPEAIKRAIDSGMDVAFSEGLLPYFLSRPDLPVDTRFAMRSEGIFSCYVSHEGEMHTSSFQTGYTDVSKWRLADSENFSDDSHEEREKRVQDMPEPNVWNYSSQSLWEALPYDTFGPRGDACGDCRHRLRCATPSRFHYFLCNYASHNKQPLKGG